MITKTSYFSFVHCPKRIWLDEFQPELAASPDSVAQRRLVAGQAVDKLARERFENGRLIPFRPQPKDMASLTEQAIAEDTETLFQATFTTDDLLVKVDVLQKTEIGWHVIEVKSGTSYKTNEHLPDVAFQVFVLQESGLNVTKASLMHLNRECHYPDLSNLFALTDVTEDVMGYLPQIGEDTAVIRQHLAQSNAPDIEIGRFCQKPHTCPFHDYCWQDMHGWTIYDIPYLKRPQEQQLESDGIRCVSDVPQDFLLRDKRATAFVERINEQQINIDQDTIRSQLDALVYPLYFLDFETIDYAIPKFDGCKPYQQMPFQYSCHVLTEDGTLTHRDYLHTIDDDPRLALTEALLNDIGDTGYIIAYNIPFERGVLRHLAEQFPEHAQRLTDMAERLWDQLTIFRKHYHDYRFGKSNSLKSVLPVVVPKLSYALLDVQNGMQAQVVWEEMIGVGDTAVKIQLANHLRAYCHLDTLAMVEIHHALQKICG